MKELEEMFGQIAKQRMVKFNLEEFKKTHPTLLKAIVEAMHINYIRGQSEASPGLNSAVNLN